MNLSLKKNSGLNRIRTHYLWETGAALYQLSYQANLELVTLLVCNIPIDDEECKWMYERSHILNCRERYEDIDDDCSYIQNLILAALNLNLKNNLGLNGILFNPEFIYLYIFSGFNSQMLIVSCFYSCTDH